MGVLNYNSGTGKYYNICNIKYAYYIEHVYMIIHNTRYIQDMCI